MTTQAQGGTSPWRIAIWGIAAMMLLLPLVAMRFTDEVKWTVSDFVFAGALILVIGGAFELAARMTRNSFYRAGAGVALAATFLTVWVNGAVGMIGSEGNPYNLLFGGVILIALLGALLVRFAAGGMALAMLAAAVAQLLVSAAGLSTDPLGGVFSMGFTLFWLLSAALFQRAARQQDMVA